MNTNLEVIRAIAGGVLAVFALLLISVLMLFLLDNVQEASRGEALTAALTAITGIVSGYIGYQVGGAGKQEAEEKKDKAKEDLSTALGALTPKQLESMPTLKTVVLPDATSAEHPSDS